MASDQADFRQAFTLHRQGQLVEAEKLYQDICRRKPDHADALYLLGVIALQTGRTPRAVELIERAIEMGVRIPDAYNNLAVGLYALKRYEEALTSYDSAIAMQPDCVDAYNNRGVVLRELKRYEESLASYDKAIALDAGFADAHYNLGNTLRDLRRHQEALASYNQAVALNPGKAEAWQNRGNTLQDLERYEEALASYDKAISYKPDYVQAHNNRGLVLRYLRRLEEALTSYDSAITLHAAYAEAHNNRGNALADLRRYEEALASYEQSVALKPDYAEAHFNQSLCLLQLGRFDQGWQQHEWRMRVDGKKTSRVYPKPILRREEDSAGKTILVHWEQGFGDTIQFCRYVEPLKSARAEVILSVQKPLHRLLQQSFPEINVVAENNTPLEFDAHCPLLSLPLIFRTTIDTIPSGRRYISADNELRSSWESRLSPVSKPRIGIVWSGNPVPDPNRSIGLAAFLPLLSDNAQWVSLQKEISETDSDLLRQDGRIAFFGDQLRDFNDTAALVDLMDFVITIDTSVAHLAGAMGKPVWILLPYNPDWRWLLDRSDSPWYPTARLFRQQNNGDWRGVIDEVRANLRSAIG